MVLLQESDDSVTARHPTVRERFVTRLCAGKLDRELARGACPEMSATLALRAYALVRLKERQDLADRLAEIVFEAEAPPRCRRGCQVPIQRARVLEAAENFRALIDTLRAPCPLPARGIASVRLLLSDGCGPLHHPGSNESLGAIVDRVVTELEPLKNW